MSQTLARFWSPESTPRATRWVQVLHILTILIPHIDQVWSQKIGTQLSAAHTVVESGSNVIVGGGLYKVERKSCTEQAYLSSLQKHPCFKYFLVADNPRCRNILVAHISPLHEYLYCTYILISGVHWKDAGDSYGS